MAVRPSPEIAAVVRRVGEAWAARDFETYANQISDSPHFRAVGTDADEFWESAQAFLDVRRVQSGELVEHGWAQAEATLERVEAFEDGHVGWAVVLVAVETPVSVVHVRATAVFVLEAGAWRVVQWHSSVPQPNAEVFGIEMTTTVENLLEAVAEDTEALQALDRSAGTLTIVITDIVDSTVLTEQMGDAAWIALWKDHEADIRRITAAHSGTVVKMLGDGSMLTFESARSAVRAAVAIRASTSGFVVRTGVHSGEVVRDEGDLLGLTVNKAARVASIADGEQILASTVVVELLGPGHEWGLGEEFSVSLKGLSGVHAVVPVEPLA